MAQNSTAANALHLEDVGTVIIACFDPLEIFTLMVNGISLLINCFHLFIISQLETLKGTKYRCVLINIALADIVNTSVTAAMFTCYDFFAMNYGHGEPELRIPIMIMVVLSNYIGFQVFVVASVEKYLAICKPFGYESSTFIRRLPMHFALVWLYMFSLGAVVSLMETLNIMMNNSVMAVLQTMLFAIAPNLLSGTLLVKVYRELNNLRNIPQNSVADEKTRAAMYLIIIFTLEMIVFLLNSICVIVVKCTDELVVCKIWYAFIKAPYTMLNTFIYGWRTRSYRQCVRKVVGCNRGHISNAEI